MRPDDDTPAREYFDERAAIMEYDGGLPRHQAEFYAVVATCRFCDRLDLMRPQTLYFTMVARDLTGDEASEPSEWLPF